MIGGAGLLWRVAGGRGYGQTYTCHFSTGFNTAWVIYHGVFYITLPCDPRVDPPPPPRLGGYICGPGATGVGLDPGRLTAIFATTCGTHHLYVVDGEEDGIPGFLYIHILPDFGQVWEGLSPPPLPLPHKPI